MSKLYCAFVEIRPRFASFLDPREIAGAFVRCYCTADSESHATEQISSALDGEKLDIVDVEWCCDIDRTDWENPDDAEATRYAEEARQSGDVVCGEYHCWGDDS